MAGNQLSSEEPSPHRQLMLVISAPSTVTTPLMETLKPLVSGSNTLRSMSGADVGVGVGVGAGVGSGVGSEVVPSMG